MGVSKIETFLTVGNRHLDRNFSFVVVNSINSTVKTASVSIKKDYLRANEIIIKTGDKLYLSASVDGKKKVLIFSGAVKSVGETTAYIDAVAEENSLRLEPLNETYRNIFYKEAFDKLTNKLDYKAEDVSPGQIVLKGRPLDSFKRLIESLSKAIRKTVYYYLKRDGSLVISTNINSEKLYKIDDILLSSSAETASIFMSPELEIGNTVELRGEKKTVRSIVWDSTKQAMTYMEFMNYREPEPLPQDRPLGKEEPKKEPQDNSGEYFENPDMLADLHHEAKEKMIALAKEVKKEMGEAYVPIYITSVHRSVDAQTRILMKKLVRTDGMQNMFEYYKGQIREDEDKTNGIPRNVGESKSLNYLNALQSQFDGTNPDDRRWNKISIDHQEEITTKIRFGKKEQKDKDAVEALLKKYMNAGVFKPSLHMEKEGTVRRIDLSIAGNRKETATNILNKNKEIMKKQEKSGGYTSTTKGEPHVHLNL